MKQNKYLFLLLVALLGTSSVLSAEDTPFGKSPFSGPSAGFPSVGSVQTLSGTDYLPGEQAFQFESRVTDDESVALTWHIMPGYYLFRDQFSIVLSDDSDATLGNIDYPAGDMRFDDVLGEYEAYDGLLTLNVPIIAGNSPDVTLLVNYQGCAASGFCYPPMTQQVNVDLAEIGSSGDVSEVFPSASGAQAGITLAVSEQDTITRLLSDQKVIWILLSFFGFGLLLTFTPCVLPMIPILSGIIAGQGKDLSTGRAFILSLVYVLAMAVTYAGAGVAAGMAGTTLQASLQSPLVIITFSILFVLLALSLFGFYELRLPHALQNRLNQMSQRQRGGTYVGVAIMGFLSALVVSPCVTAPLVGALAYISTTGNASLGGGALFSMAMGMGVPLLLIGTFEGKLIPKAGHWMNTVKAIFGVLMLALAIWILERILPGPVLMFLWAGLLIVSAVYMGVLEPAHKVGWQRLWKGLGLLMVIYAVLLIIGASTGNSNPTQPLAKFSAGPVTTTGAPMQRFNTIKSSEDFDNALRAANAEGKTVMLDFYADWCASCIRMARYTFTDPDVQAVLADTVLLKADVTANDAIDRELMRRFNVYAPPAILFFGTDGVERSAYRVVGEMGAEDFERHADHALAQ